MLDLHYACSFQSCDIEMMRMNNAMCMTDCLDPGTAFIVFVGMMMMVMMMMGGT